MVCSSGATAEHVRRVVRAGERRVEHEKREEPGCGRERWEFERLYRERREEGESPRRERRLGLHGAINGEGNGGSKAPLTPNKRSGGIAWVLARRGCSAEGGSAGS